METYISFLQHLVLGIKFAVAYAIPDIPEWVEHEIAKMEFQRREALKVHNESLHFIMNSYKGNGVVIVSRAAFN